MPPVQCPECGRFLKKTFVVSLSERPAPCPGCEVELRPEMLDVPDERTDRPDRTHDADGTYDAASPASPASTASVRPPDLEPDRVRDLPSDVLRGWDPGGLPDAGALDRAPFPTDTVVVAASGAAGLGLGLVLGRDRRATSAIAGAAAGIVVAAVARQLWRLEV